MLFKSAFIKFHARQHDEDIIQLYNNIILTKIYIQYVYFKNIK